MGGLTHALEFNKMRKNIVAGNWKMNLNRAEAIALVNEVLSKLPNNNLAEIVFAPSNVYLHKLAKMCANINKVSVASQDCSENIKGAFTGEVSASMIASCNVEYVILGHSERRTNFNETNDLRAWSYELQFCGAPFSFSMRSETPYQLQKHDFTYFL